MPLIILYEAGNPKIELNQLSNSKYEINILRINVLFGIRAFLYLNQVARFHSIAFPFYHDFQPLFSHFFYLR